MKMTKKILTGAIAAVALVVGLSSCADLGLSGLLQKNKAFGEVTFKYQDATYDSGNGTWKVEQSNESTEDYARGGQLLLTKHSDITAVAKINNQTATSNDGVIGVAFDVNKHDDLYDMIIAGVRYNNGKAQSYVSFFANINEDNLGKKNLGATTKSGNENVKTAYVKDSTECYEVVCQTAFTDLKGIEADTDGTVTVVIAVTEDQKTGDYTVKFYKADAYNATKHTLDLTGKTPVAGCTIPAAKVGKEKAAQAGIGVYSNIYKATKSGPTKLTASLEIMDLTNDAIAE